LPKCIDYSGVKSSHSANKKTKFWIQQRSKVEPKALWSGSTGLSGVHRTVSGAPPDSVRCTRGLQLELATFGNFPGRRAIIHRTVRCTPDSVRCAKEERPQELASFGKRQRLVRYNSPDCPVCTGLSGEPPEQRLVGANGYLRRIKCARSVRRSQARPYWHTGQQTVLVRCAPDTQAGPHVRSSNG
jgi:hypothetical protein